jgi:1,4-dihydroxy-2-naphthoyl-CoA synthase
VLRDLERVGLVDGHQLVSKHHVVMNPAYVHITVDSLRDVAEKKALLREHGVHSLGRYGSWTYCSIEDNIVEARAVIACLHGQCIGGGIDIAAACDIRLASADAKLSVREVRVAMVADLGSLQRLPRILGQGITRELAYTGKDVSAARAKEIHLVNEVYADKEALLEGARAMARDIAKNPPLVVQGIKEVLDFGERSRVRDKERFVAVWNSAFLASSDLAEAMAAFMERREPVFKGE